MEILPVFVKSNSAMLHLRHMRWLLIRAEPLVKEFPLLFIVVEPKPDVLMSANEFENVVEAHFHPFVEGYVGLNGPQEAFEPIV